MKSLIPTGQDYIGSGAWYQNSITKPSEIRFRASLAEDPEVITLAIFQQLRGVESSRYFLREVARFFGHLFPKIVGLHPSSFHRRLRKLRRFLEPLRRAIVPELVGDPETKIVDSTMLEVLHPRQVPQSAGLDGQRG
jgi:hypothetical protein